MFGLQECYFDRCLQDVLRELMRMTIWAIAASLYPLLCLEIEFPTHLQFVYGRSAEREMHGGAIEGS
jgi:hypothetical protein